MKNDLGSSLSPAALLRPLKRRKLILLIPVLLLTPAVAWYTLHLPQKFRAKALVGASRAIPGHIAIVPRPEAAVINAQDQLRAIRETLLDSALVEQVIQEFDLYNPPADGNWAGLAEAAKSRIQLQVEGPEAFYVGFESTQPEQAMRVANRLAGLFLERTSTARGVRVRQEDTFLDREVDQLRKQVTQEEDQLRAFKSSVAQQLPERLSANLKQLETLQQQIHSKTDQITEGQARIATITEELRNLESRGVLEPELPAKTTADTTLEQLRLRLNELRTKYTAEHPELRRAEQQIRDMEANKAPAAPVRQQATPVQLRYVSLQAELKSIEPRLNSYRREREALMAELSSYERRVNSSPGFEAAISQRMRDASVTRTRYETLLAKQQETKLAHKVEQTDSGLTYKILEPATLPTAPTGPHRRIILLLGLIGSLGIGIAGVVLAERMNPSFETAEQLARFTNLPVLTSVPTISDRPARKSVKKTLRFDRLTAPVPEDPLTGEQKKHFGEHRLSVLTDPQSVAAQQYSILALKVQHWMYQSGGKILTVTSATGAEGKSVTSINLALALASTLEGRVLLIDGDLRLPQVHERLKLNPEKGFGDLLSARTTAAACITRVGNLEVMTGGSKQNNPVGLLASQWTREALASLREQYQVIVIDSPPVVPIADSHILAGLSDGVIFVVRARMTRPELFQRGVESLGAANLVGVVLNDVELAATPYAYAYQHYENHYLGRS